MRVKKVVYKISGNYFVFFCLLGLVLGKVEINGWCLESWEFLLILFILGGWSFLFWGWWDGIDFFIVYNIMEKN